MHWSLRIDGREACVNGLLGGQTYTVITIMRVLCRLPRLLQGAVALLHSTAVAT